MMLGRGWFSIERINAIKIFNLHRGDWIDRLELRNPLIKPSDILSLETKCAKFFKRESYINPVEIIEIRYTEILRDSAIG